MEILMSVVSLYGKVLSEEEFKASPMILSDYCEKKQKVIRASFLEFYEKYISKTTFLNYSKNNWKAIPIVDIKHELDKFLSENKEVYYDEINKIFFCSNFDLEFIIYSFQPFFLSLSPLNILHQRVKNQKVEYEDTVLFDMGWKIKESRNS